MADGSKIEWTEATWNPIRGCSRVSAGCANCYAERVAARFAGEGMPYEGLAVIDERGPRWTGVVRLFDEQLKKPLQWTRPRRIFVNSMSDLFHEGLDGPTIARVFAVMALAKRHTFQVLTKRASRMREILTDPAFRAEVAGTAAAMAVGRRDVGLLRAEYLVWPLPNVWIGVSVEHQEAADERIPELLATPAAVRWLSVEPMLGPVDLHRVPLCEPTWDGEVTDHLDWVVCGGESGPGARRMTLAWARALRDQCVAAGVPFFFKQWGAWMPLPGLGELRAGDWVDPQTDTDPAVMRRVAKADAGRLLDGRTWDEYPRGTGA